jgi:hypothetical protein
VTTPDHTPPEALRAAADAYDDAAVRRLDLGQTTALIADAVWRLAVAEGRRQATEGREREWGVDLPGTNLVHVCLDEADARESAAAERPTMAEPSPPALDAAEDLMEQLRRRVLDASIELAQDRDGMLTRAEMLAALEVRIDFERTGPW